MVKYANQFIALRYRQPHNGPQPAEFPQPTFKPMRFTVRRESIEKI